MTGGTGASPWVTSRRRWIAMNFSTDTAKLVTELLGGFGVSTGGSKIHHSVDHVIGRQREVVTTKQFLGSSRHRVVTR